MLRDHIKFLTEFIRRPQNTGAIAPSSRALADTIVEEIGLQTASLVVEYGPGSGAFTGKILETLRDSAEFVAFENNLRMHGEVSRKFPGVDIIHDSIVNAEGALEERGYAAGSVDAIVSGLPWAAFPDPLQESLLEVTFDILKPGGHFATFAYIHGTMLPAGKRFREKLERHFDRVDRSPIVWRNLPPAFVYRCTVALEAE